ncbi:MAG TPA: TRAP transporter large permease subunit [Candidatus Limnocylindria bacterium]|nr:TRAP transporter large permease subunit [Candidatus Limnocylindria bacterium]
MSPEALGIAMLALMVVAILIGFPTAFTLMSLGVTFGFLGIGWVVFDLVVQRTFFVMQNDVLVAIPLFLFMGYLVERAGIVDKLFLSVQLLMGGLPGALALATLFTGALFATATGIVGASVTLLGLLALPAMIRRGYDVSFGSGVIVAAGTLGILIPPSVLLILYGFIAGVSVPRLYAAAFIPGFILVALYLVYIVFRAARNPSIAPAMPIEERTIPLGQIIQMLVTGLLPILSLILFVLGAIFFGFATPSEAAALGSLGGLLLAAMHRRLSFSMLKESIFLTVRASAMVGWLLVGSSIFAAVFARLGGAAVVGEFLDGLGLDPVQFVILVQIVIFLLGWPLEWTEITIIFLPLFLPLLRAYEIDLVWFGVLASLNMQTAFLSPPVAMSAYYLMNVAPKGVLLTQIFRGMYPYIGLQVISMVLLYLFPQLATWLPTLIYGKQ